MMNSGPAHWKRWAGFSLQGSGLMLHRSKDNMAFTVPEVLAVVAIIAILMALLLPMFAKGKHAAKRVLCANNLKQFVLADLAYATENGQKFPISNGFIPTSISYEHLAYMARNYRWNIPPAPVSAWPRRAQQPPWINCPMAVDSGHAEGLTLGGGLYTGYVYVGGIESSNLVASYGGVITKPGHAAAARKDGKRGVLWADIITEFLTTEPRRFEFFHYNRKTPYPDFLYEALDLDGINRAWSDGSVEWLPGNSLKLTGPGSPDLQIKHLFGNLYY